jgi:glycosyltransferase involved in cell wall biosynthesis
MRAPSMEEYQRRLAHSAGSAAVRRITTRGQPVDSVPPDGLLSVVTVTYNSAATLARTFRSVFGQTYPHVEYIVIDGGSRDGTLDIIQADQERLSYWHSARDRGISDAFNLGIAAAAGTYVALVNSDDWLSQDQLEHAVRAMRSSEAAFAFGRLAYHGGSSDLLYVMDGEADYWRHIRHRMPGINHATVVARRSAYERVGLFNPRWRIAMDYDWHLRAELAGLRGVYVPELIGHMAEGGVCFTNWQDGLREVRDAAIAHGQPALPARWHCSVRIARGTLREAARRVLPKPVVDRLHRLVNPAYRPVPGSSNEAR